MSKTYEVWDSRSGNRLGTFRRVDLARQLVERVFTQDLSALTGLGLLLRDGEALTLLAEGEYPPYHQASRVPRGSEGACLSLCPSPGVLPRTVLVTAVAGRGADTTT